MWLVQEPSPASGCVSDCSEEGSSNVGSASEVQQIWLAQQLEQLQLESSWLDSSYAYASAEGAASTKAPVVLLSRGRRRRRRKWRALKVVKVQLYHRWRRTPLEA